MTSQSLLPPAGPMPSFLSLLEEPSQSCRKSEMSSRPLQEHSQQATSLWHNQDDQGLWFSNPAYQSLPCGWQSRLVETGSVRLLDIASPRLPGYRSAVYLPIKATRVDGCRIALPWNPPYDTPCTDHHNYRRGIETCMRTGFIDRVRATDWIGRIKTRIMQRHELGA